MESRLPSLLGLCQSDYPQIANYVNSAQERLLMAIEARDEGWWGTWAEIAFNVSRCSPYITLPREVARIEALNICNVPVFVQNQFFEYLRFGNGRLPKQFNQGNGWFGCATQAFSRNNAVTSINMTNAPQYLTAYVANPLDADGTKRILFQGLDASGNQIYSLDVDQNVRGAFSILSYPSVTSAQTFTEIQGIQKDVTFGEVRIYQHDPTTGDEILLLTMQPSETTASYRRYYFDSLPWSCCGCPTVPGIPDTIQVTAIAKLELIPVKTMTDYTLIQSKEAIICECQAIRMSEMDANAAMAKDNGYHKQAIGLLNGELAHYLGLDNAAVTFRPFGSARLQRQKIGSLI